MNDKSNSGSFVPGGYSRVGGLDFFPLSGGYGDNEIKVIKDPEGGKRAERDMPTAIPSPFARFDLVAVAFKSIAGTGDLRASSIGTDVIASKDEERLVSHTLDLAEIIFDKRKYGDNLEISAFDCSINNLKGVIGDNRQPVKYRRFVSSLVLYLEQDKNTYNFDHMDSVFLFKYKNVVIGSTSPVTLFCPTANNVLDSETKDYAVVELGDQRKAFSEDFKPLYERSPDFQKWFHCLARLFKVREGVSLREEAMASLEAYAEKNEECLRIAKQNGDSKKRGSVYIHRRNKEARPR